jgi:hypothetical protein
MFGLARTLALPSRQFAEDLIGLFPDDFDQHTFSATAIELAVEDLFPRAEVELAFGDGDDDLAAHDLPFHVGVGIVFAGAVVLVLGGGRVGGELFEPDIVVVQQAVFGVIDIDAGGAMRCLIVNSSKDGR